MKKLKIAQVAPLWFPIPPEKYGGIEWVIYNLVEGLVKKGHDEEPVRKNHACCSQA